MSKALPIAIAVILGGAALVPVYYASQHPADVNSHSMSKNAKPVEKISYALGYEVASQTPPEVDVNTFISGIRDGHAKKQRAYTDEELQAAYVDFQKEMQQKQLQQTQETASSNDSFLAANAKKKVLKQRLQDCNIKSLKKVLANNLLLPLWSLYITKVSC